MSISQRMAFFILISSLVSVSIGHAALISQVDDFQLGSAHGWGADQQEVAIETDGGPDGAGDRYLAYASHGGGGAGGRMVIPNETAGSQWLGDYNSLGAESIIFDIKNFGATQLDLRLAISNGTTWFATTTAHVLPAASAWTSVAFQLSEPEISVLGSGSESLAQVLGSVTKLRLLSSVNLPTVSFGGTGGARGDLIAASIGFDNVRFGAVPEPSSVGLLVLAASLLPRCRK